MDLNFVELFNKIVDLAKPVHAAKSHASSLDAELQDLGIDSLDTILISIYFGDIYGIDEETMKQMRVTTIKDLQDFLLSHATHTPQTIEEAMGRVQ